VTSSQEIAQFQTRVADCTYRLFEGVGHFAHAERAETYAALVTDFILS
jgi:pimeloyl-ACP methyl ester carboxylesterase